MRQQCISTDIISHLFLQGMVGPQGLKGNRVRYQTEGFASYEDRADMVLAKFWNAQRTGCSFAFTH